MIRDNEIIFIDPRGYFGNTKLYGLKQYDFAKLLFGLSGYIAPFLIYLGVDTFDSNNYVQS